MKIKVTIAILVVITAITAILLSNTPTITRDILVKIKYKDPQNLLKVPPYPKEIELRVEGPEKKINLLKKKDYEIDLTEAKKGVNKIEVKSFLKLPKGVKIIRYAPEFINVHLETRAYKRFPVHVVTSGKTAAGYWLISTVVEPQMVLLSGPSHIIKNIKKVKTKPVELKNSKESFRKEIALDLDESIENRSGKIYAKLEITEKIVVKKIRNIPVRGTGLNREYKIVPEFMDVEIKGPESLMRQKNIRANIDVFINLKGLKKGIYVRRAAISIPLNFKLVKAKPANFTVNIN